MIKRRITVKEVVSLLNEALRIDEQAINEIFMTLQDANEELGNHEKVACYRGANGGIDFGLLGLLSGFFCIPAFQCSAIPITFQNNKITKFHEMTDSVEESITVDGVISLLNDVVRCDQQAISKLFFNRVQCNDSLAEHATIRVVAGSTRYVVGALGLINGMFGVDDNGQGAIAMIRDNENILSFRKTNVRGDSE